MTLTIDDLGYYYGSNPDNYLFKEVTETFEAGQLYAILGQSGSGKTTLLSLLAGLDKPKSGKILLDDQAINQIGLTKYRQQHVSTVFQAYNLLPYMTAYQNVQTALELSKAAYPDAKQAIERVLDQMGLDETLFHKRVSFLSGGQQQRVAIARALITQGDIVIADEPTGNLDEQMTQEIVSVFKQIAHEGNKIVILVTHEQEVAKQCDVVYELRQRTFKRKTN